MNWKAPTRIVETAGGAAFAFAVIAGPLGCALAGDAPWYQVTSPVDWALTAKRCLPPDGVSQIVYLATDTGDTGIQIIPEAENIFTTGHAPTDTGERKGANMPADEQAHEDWGRLIEDWRNVWDPWNGVMDRIARAFSWGENPETADLDLADHLDEKIKAAEAKMDEFRNKLMLRSRQRWGS